MAADYSQVELRILAHLSGDRRLIQALNSGADVFKSIAAEWKMIDPEAVRDDTRQQAKQVIFGKSSYLYRMQQLNEEGKRVSSQGCWLPQELLLWVAR